MRFTLEESMAELSELAGTAGLEVAGSTYQRVLEPNPRTYIGTGKVRLLRGLREAARCAGFGSRPTMVKEARVLCVSCRTCGAVVSFLLGLLEKDVAQKTLMSPGSSCFWNSAGLVGASTPVPARKLAAVVINRPRICVLNSCGE